MSSSPPPSTPSKEESTPPESTSAKAETPAAEKTDDSVSTPSTTADHRTKRVYVGNLAWGVSWQDLKDHMKSTGLEVKIANVMTSADGRSKGCGIVEFHTVEDAQQAVEALNDTELRGRRIFVREDREDMRHAQSAETKHRRVYVGNLSWDVAWQDLKDHMRDAGEVVHAEVIREHNGRSKGCGIVEYATDDDAQNAITTLNDSELRGRMIFVREDRETGGSPSPVLRGGNLSVYVWNLAPETTWQELKDHMRKAGNVDSATVLPSQSGESNCGVVVYQRPQEAMRAIRELQGSELNGQAISIREDRVRKRGGGAPRGRRRAEIAVQINNLASDTTWRELKDHFRQCGDVAHAEVAKSGGTGVVQFANKPDAEAAVSRLDGSELQGNKLEVSLK